MATAAPTNHKRRSCGPLKYRFFFLFILVSFSHNFCVIAQQDETPKDETVEALHDEDAFPVEHGLMVLSSLSDISAALDANEPKLLLVAIYSPSCTQHCTSLLIHLEHAARQFEEYLESMDNQDALVMMSPAPLFAKLDATWMDPKVLEEKLDVTNFPTLLTVTGTQQNAVIRDWFGSIETATELFNTICHYWYRWNGLNENHGAILSVNNVHDFLVEHGAGALQMVPPALDSNLSLEEVSHIEWLLSETTRDFFILIVLCEEDEEHEEEFSQAADVMAAKRNVLFLQSHECTDIIDDVNTDNGAIAALFLDPPTDWNHWKDSIVQTTFYDANKYDYMEQWIVQMTTPTVLWYDYKSVAPICFEKWRKIHAVLCVDIDDYTSTQRAISEFSNACRHAKLNQQEDFVCLIVPQTERLIFNTLGIDLWSPLDFAATQSGPIQPVLPTLVITDSRGSATTTRRFYLDAPDLLSSTSAIDNFMNQFWRNQLTPFVKSSSARQKVRINTSGVQVLTGASFSNAVLNQEEKYTLLYLFLPTCSHCKRFSIVWNELSRLLQTMGWHHQFQIAKMDVTTNEVLDLDLDTREVPQVYLIPKREKTPIRYTVVDEFNDGPGRLSDSLDIVEWLLDVADDHEQDLDLAQLLHLLQETETNASVQENDSNNDTVESNHTQEDGSSNDTEANSTQETEHLKESDV